MDDNEFIHFGKKRDLLLSTACDEALSWMTVIWMKNHLVSDKMCNTVNL